MSNFERGWGGGVVLPHHENFARKLCKIHWITEQTWLWSGNGIMDAQTPKIIAGWISQWVYVEQYPCPFITSSSGVMDTITVSSSFTSIYSTIPPATKSCQLGKNKCYYFSLMYLFIALNKVLFTINERVGHLGGKEVNRDIKRQTTWGIRCLTLDIRHWISDITPQKSNIRVDIRHHTFDIEHQTLDIQHKTSDVWDQRSEVGHHTSDIGHQTSDIGHKK